MLFVIYRAESPDCYTLSSHLSRPRRQSANEVSRDNYREIQAHDKWSVYCIERWLLAVVLAITAAFAAIVADGNSIGSITSHKHLGYILWPTFPYVLWVSIRCMHEDLRQLRNEKHVLIVNFLWNVLMYASYIIAWVFWYLALNKSTFTYTEALIPLYCLVGFKVIGAFTISGGIGLKFWHFIEKSCIWSGFILTFIFGAVVAQGKSVGIISAEHDTGLVIVPFGIAVCWLLMVRAFKERCSEYKTGKFLLGLLFYSLFVVEWVLLFLRLNNSISISYVVTAIPVFIISGMMMFATMYSAYESHCFRHNEKRHRKASHV